MGLAEPRKRIKLSHDPRNTAWTNSTDSYGHRLMQQQGWKAGEALGAKGKGSKYADAEAAKVNVKYKDDTLGLGASLKSKDFANQRTGFDAFQGLLGRLNAKTEAEVQAVEKKVEDKKLAMFAQGRWGGMLFVPGGLLVQSDPYKQVEELKKIREQVEAEKDVETEQHTKVEEGTGKIQRRAEKEQRKEEKRLRKEAKRLKKKTKLGKIQNESEPGLPTPDASSANETEMKDSKKKNSKSKSKKRQLSPEISEEKEVDVSRTTEVKSVVVQQVVRTGRQLLRGKNIQAKRMAFSDIKGLDEIFMRTG